MAENDKTTETRGGPLASETAGLWGPLSSLRREMDRLFDDFGTSRWPVPGAMRLMAAIAANRVVTDPAAGTYTVYDDDSTTVLASGDLWQDAAGTTPYAGSGAERRDRLT